MTEWISIDDSWPQSDFEVLVAVDDDVFTDIFRCGCVEGEYYFDSELNSIGKRITHWMPLPEPPKDKVTAKE